MPEVKLSVTDVPVGEGRVIEDGDRAFAVFNLDGTFHAMDNACPHRGGPLGEGWIEDGVVVCPWHGWEFEIATGACTMNAALCQKRYPVRVEGDTVIISYE